MPRKTRRRGDLKTARSCFNEAAARCRGKLLAPVVPEPHRIVIGFNEAAARCRGKRTMTPAT